MKPQSRIIGLSDAGEKVSIVEVESVLKEHPLVKQAAVKIWSPLPHTGIPYSHPFPPKICRHVVLIVLPLAFCPSLW